jgi:hypothetical protein
MQELIELFLSTIKKRNHVQKLLENSGGLKIKLVCEDSQDFLVLNYGESFLVNNNDNYTEACVINGNRDSLYLLLEGKEKLRDLIKKCKIEVYATFRTLLLIESIFYLTKIDRSYSKNFV